MAKSGTMADGSGYASASKSEAKAGGRKPIKRVTIEVAKNGGFVVSCEYQPTGGTRGDAVGPYAPPDEYVFANKAAMDAFTDQLFGIKDAPVYKGSA